MSVKGCKTRARFGPLLLLQHLPGLHLTCADVNGAMVEETARYLKSHGQSNFVAQRIDASDLRLPDGALDCVVTFNAIHHFDPVAFLGQAAQAVKSSGHVFVYTRLKSQNARNIWGRFFPGFPEKETRLYDLGYVESWADRLDGLNLETIEFSAGKHYSTFSLYSADELRKALEIFEARLAQHFMGCDQIRWTDENVMMVFRKN
jgi:ubiquinone/menaquinone biosynthesis C-methylase UbiE